jgi:hypothetical protein
MYEDKISFGVMFLIIAGCKKETVRLSSDLQETWELVSSNGAWICHRNMSLVKLRVKLLLSHPGMQYCLCVFGVLVEKTSFL